MDSAAELQVKVGILQKEQEHQQKYLDRIDIAIEKLEEISANTVKIIALHEQKLDLHTTTDNQIQTQIDDLDAKIIKNELTTSNTFTTIDIKLDNFEKKIDCISTDVNSLKTDLEKRISNLEKYLWLISSICGGLYLILYNIDKIKLFFQ
jgi:chromosome segregation ATPase